MLVITAGRLDVVDRHPASPTINAITALGGSPASNIGMKLVCAPALFSRLGRGNAADIARPNGGTDCA